MTHFFLGWTIPLQTCICKLLLCYNWLSYLHFKWEVNCNYIVKVHPEMKILSSFTYSVWFTFFYRTESITFERWTMNGNVVCSSKYHFWGETIPFRHLRSCPYQSDSRNSQKCLCNWGCLKENIFWSSHQTVLWSELPKTAQYTGFEVSILNTHRLHAFDQIIILAVSFSAVLLMFGRKLIPTRAPEIKICKTMTDSQSTV